MEMGHLNQYFDNGAYRVIGVSWLAEFRLILSLPASRLAL
jgi:hypothetical protein